MIKIMFIGDICTDSYSTNDIEIMKKTRLYSFLNNYDGIIIGNLEAPILDKNIIDNKNKYSLKNKPIFSELYQFCNIFTLANNHMFDQGFEGYKNTIKFLNENNKSYFGAGDNLFNARTPFIFNDIYFYNYNCYSTNSDHNAKNSSFGTSPLVYEYIIEDIKKAKKENANKIFILLHWGIENEFYPTAEQVGMARRLIDAGADGIIGTHPHVIQAFEVYKNKPIYYSLGNFFFNDFIINKQERFYQHKFNKEGMMVEIQIDNDIISMNEYYFKFDNNMIPELIEKERLETNIQLINQTLVEKTKELKHNKQSLDLPISLKYNGKFMQLIYDTLPIDKITNIKYEQFKIKLKRFILKLLRKIYDRN